MGIEWVDAETLARREAAIKRIKVLDGYLKNATRLAGASSKAIKRWDAEREQLRREFGLTPSSESVYECEPLFGMSARDALDRFLKENR